MRTFSLASVFSLSVALVFGVSDAWAAPDVGSMVSLRGDAIIERDGNDLKAVKKDNIMLQDVISTMTKSRAKILFLDDSILTLGSKSRASIEKFIYSKEGGGASIFNLIEGSMRSIVGKTAYEVHTSTSVAAARGTAIDFKTGVHNGKPYTSITCLRGSVEVRSTDPLFKDMVLLSGGEMITVFEGASLPMPTPVSIDRLVQKKAAKKKKAVIRATAAEKAGSGEEGADGEQGPDEMEMDEPDIIPLVDDLIIGEMLTPEAEILPPVEQEPEVVKTPVGVIIFIRD
jgi:hypothetical protein